VLAIAEHAPDVGDRLRERPFAHNHVRPHQLDQVVLANDLAGSATQSQQDIERLLAQTCELAPGGDELASRQIEHERA
jgi:hypothetical protein